MIPQANARLLQCAMCSTADMSELQFTMAFQPIVNVVTKEVFAQEALVRGTEGQGSAYVFDKVNAENQYRFDHAARVKAVELAASLHMTSFLSINFMPKAILSPATCVRTTLDAAARCDFPIGKLIFEITETEKIDDVAHVREIVKHYKWLGFQTALDDFGAGYSGLNLLAELQTDFVKLDMALVRNVDQDSSRRAIAKGILQVCRDLSMQVIAEGVETYEEFRTLGDLGIELFQGYYFARPSFESLTNVPIDRFRAPVAS